MRIVFVIFLLINSLAAKEELVGIFYYKNIFGHVHKNPLSNSSSLTAIQCGYPIKVISSSDVVHPASWSYVNVGEHKGFIENSHLLAKRPECFQVKYNKFFNNLNLDLNDMYYWGKLSDQYIQGESKIK